MLLMTCHICNTVLDKKIKSPCNLPWMDWVVALWLFVLQYIIYNNLHVTLQQRFLFYETETIQLILCIAYYSRKTPIVSHTC